ncbi:unnamed protein product [Diatraea saccharalis]|uniref:Uncharacterized protein n=1 Tax=Diatraea saccharalis TaxID=40085 RepID=A0A9N9WBH5_9NEOP|nr:unnamed protein product [Diatraea saccharalis]
MRHAAGACACACRPLHQRECAFRAVHGAGTSTLHCTTWRDMMYIAGARGPREPTTPVGPEGKFYKTSLTNFLKVKRSTMTSFDRLLFFVAEIAFRSDVSSTSRSIISPNGRNEITARFTFRKFRTKETVGARPQSGNKNYCHPILKFPAVIGFRSLDTAQTTALLGFGRDHPRYFRGTFSEAQIDGSGTDPEFGTGSPPERRRARSRAAIDSHGPGGDRGGSQLVPLLVLVLEHELVRGGGELGGLRVHPLGAVLQLRQLVPALQHQLVRARHLAPRVRRARPQRLHRPRPRARPRALHHAGHGAVRLAAALSD